MIDNLALVPCIREPDADAQYDDALMYAWRGYLIHETTPEPPVGYERARVYTYPRPARSADREKGAIVCGA